MVSYSAIQSNPFLTGVVEPAKYASQWIKALRLVVSEFEASWVD